MNWVTRCAQPDLRLSQGALRRRADSEPRAWRLGWRQRRACFPPPRLSPHTRSCTARALRLTGSSIRVGGWTDFLARALAREWRDSAPRIFRRAYSAGDMG